MPAITDFLKANKATAVNLALFGPGYAKDIGQAENKIKAIAKATADWLFWTLKVLSPLRQIAVGGFVILGFKAMGDAIQNIVRQTGSLEAALKRLQSIQAAQRGLAPFVGGAGARQRVAELTTMAGRGPFKFEEIADANKQLEILTRGAFSSAQATQKIGQAAIATGHDIGAVADAVGQFYDNLREGRPIASSAENLRQLGIISQQTANQLVSMQETGATSTEMFGRLSLEIDQAAASMKDMGDTVAVVDAEYQKASEGLRQKFGAPWTANDIENTKNMTAAMQAVAPAVGRISQTWATLFNGFGTLRTEMIKFLATTPAVRGGIEFLIKSFTGLLTAAMAVATIGLPFLIPQINNLIILLTTKLLGANTAVRIFSSGWGTFIKGFTAIGAIGLAVTGAAMLTGAIVNLVHAHREAGRELDRQNQAFDKGNQAIKEQIANAKSLAEQQDAVAAAMNQAVDAYGKVVDVQKELSDVTSNYLTNILDPLAIPKLILQLKELDKSEAASVANLKKAAATAAEAIRTRGAVTGPALAAFGESLRQRRFQEEERQFRLAQQREPGRRPEILQAQALLLRRRAATGDIGAAERARVEHDTAELTKQQSIHEATAQLLEKSGAAQGKVTEERDKAAQVEGQILVRQKDARKGTAVQIEAQIRQNQLAIEAGAALEAGDKERGHQLFLQAGGQAAVTEQEREQLRQKNIILQLDQATAEQFEKQRNQLREQSEDLSDNAVALKREQSVTRQTADIELQRRIAQREGRSQEAIGLRDQEEFIKRFEELRQTLPETEARRRAFEETRETIKETAGAEARGGLPVVASALARIGGGGGVYAPGGDPNTTILKRTQELTRKANEFLKTVADSVSKGGGID